MGSVKKRGGVSVRSFNRCFYLRIYLHRFYIKEQNKNTVVIDDHQYVSMKVVYKPLSSSFNP